ncbi:Rne/Rng family ribonuclease [Fervidobacterium sp.]
MIVIINKKDDKPHAALFESGKLIEVYFPDDEESVAGSIFVGKIEKFVPALEAAFVKLSNEENGFLRLKDIRSEYLQFFGLKKLQEGQKVLVQIKKEGGHTKGPQVTTNIGIPGRYLVLMPFSHNIGISRKVLEADRTRLKEVGLKLREKYGAGFIIRTAAVEVSDEYIFEEAEMLFEKWKILVNNFKKAKKNKLLHKESDLDSLILREFLRKDVEEIITNDISYKEIIRKHAKNIRIKVVEGDAFEKFGVNEELKRVLQRSIPLPSGGEIVIDKTEAMVVIDVNSGHYTTSENHEELSERINAEAAREIARILRLRNLGGIIIIDFIDMRSEKSKNNILQIMKSEVIKDRNRVEIYGFTELGLLEMTRKRTSRSLDERLTVKCPVCNGTGNILSPDIVLENLFNALSNGPKDISEVIIKLHPSFKERIKKEEIKKFIKIDVHIHFTHVDPTNFELTWKK